MVASPAACSACASTNRASPEAPAPRAWFHAARRRHPPATAPPAPTATVAATPRCRRPTRSPSSTRASLLRTGRRRWDVVRETAGVSPTATHAPDAVAAEAVDVARAAAEVDAPGLVGDHVGVEHEADRVVTHLFQSRDPGYRGWRWAVTVSRAARSKTVTVDEVVLLPGEDALRAPEWVPWSERLRPGDLGVGDLLPTTADDPRLAPTFLSDPDDQEVEV